MAWPQFTAFRMAIGITRRMVLTSRGPSGVPPCLQGRRNYLPGEEILCAIAVCQSICIDVWKGVYELRRQLSLAWSTDWPFLPGRLRSYGPTLDEDQPWVGRG